MFLGFYAPIIFVLYFSAILILSVAFNFIAVNYFGSKMIYEYAPIYLKDIAFLSFPIFCLFCCIKLQKNSKFNFFLFQALIAIMLGFMVNSIYHNELTYITKFLNDNDEIKRIDSALYLNYFKHFFNMNKYIITVNKYDIIFVLIGGILLFSIYYKTNDGYFQKVNKTEHEKDTTFLLFVINDYFRSFKINFLKCYFYIFIIYIVLRDFHAESMNFSATAVTTYYKLLFILLVFYINSQLEHIKLNSQNFQGLFKFLIIVHLVIAIQIIFYNLIINSYLFDVLLLFILISLRDKIKLPTPNKDFTNMLFFILLYEISYFLIYGNSEIKNDDFYEAFYRISQSFIAFSLFMYKDLINKIIYRIFPPVIIYDKQKSNYTQDTTNLVVDRTIKYKNKKKMFFKRV